MWLFVNCLVENPTFDSQTKENMTLQQKSFGSTCHLSDKFIKQVLIKYYLYCSLPLKIVISLLIPLHFLLSTGHLLWNCGKYHELGEVQGSIPAQQEMLSCQTHKNQRGA